MSNISQQSQVSTILSCFCRSNICEAYDGSLVALQSAFIEVASSKYTVLPERFASCRDDFAEEITLTVQ